jgi:hypothetical protein
MEAGKFSFKFSRQTQKNLVGSSKYAYFSAASYIHFVVVVVVAFLIAIVLETPFCRLVFDVPNKCL